MKSLRSINIVLIGCLTLIIHASCHSFYENQHIWRKIELASIEWNLRTRGTMNFKSIWEHSEVYRDTIEDIEFISSIENRIHMLMNIEPNTNHDVRIACLCYRNNSSIIDTLTIGRFTIKLNQDLYELDENLLNSFSDRLPKDQQLDIQESLQIRRELQEKR